MTDHNNIFETDETAPARPRWLVAIATLVVFIAVDRLGLSAFRSVAGEWEGYPRLLALAVLGYGAYVAAPLALAAVLFGPRRAFDALGLDRSIVVGLVFGLAATSVFVAGVAATAPFAPPDNAVYVAIQSALLPGVFEEILYRAFLFGFLFRFAGWGFLPAALAGAALFGAGHLYQGETPLDALMVFAFTAIGGLWFAWLYVEWNYNVWAPAAIHVLLNLYWGLWDVADTAVGPPLANGLRIVVIVLSIVITLIVAHRRGGLIVRGKRWLF